MIKRIAVGLILFLLPLVVRAQTSFTVIVNSSSPTSIVTTTGATRVTVQQVSTQNPSVTYYITDPNVNGGARQTFPPGTPYIFSFASGFVSGSTIGTIQIAGGPNVVFTVTQTGSSQPSAPPTPLSNINFIGAPSGSCGPNQTATNQLTGDLYNCNPTTGTWVFAAGSSAVTSVFGRTGTIAAAVNDYAFSQISGLLGHGQLPTLVSGDIPNNAANTSGNAATATSIAGTPAQCSGANFATGIQPNGTANCSTPNGLGSVTLTGTPAGGQVPTATSGTTATWQTPSGGGGGTVSSVFGRTGAIVAASNDYSFGQISGTLGHAQLPALLSGDIPSNAANTSGTAANATAAVALKTAPTQCGPGDFATGIAVSGNANCGTVAATNVSGLAASATTNTTNATNIISGTLPHAQLPALLSGDIPSNAANTSGTAATATALAAIPTQCSGSNFAVGITANGSANCATPAGSGGNVTGSSLTSNDVITGAGSSAIQDSGVTISSLQTPMTTLGDTVTGGASGVPTRLAGPSTLNGVVRSLVSIPSAGAATVPSWQLPVYMMRAVAGTTSTDTILSTDCNPYRVDYQGSVSVAVTLPTAATLGVANCHFHLANNTSGSSSTVTVTPTTWNILPGTTSLVIAQGQTCDIFEDASGPRWNADCADLPYTAGTGISIARGQYGPVINSTSAATVSGSGTATSIPIWSSTTGLGNSLTSETGGTLVVADANGVSASALTTTGAGPWRAGGVSGALGGCTTPVSGSTFLCNVTGTGMEMSISGGAYAPLGPGNNPGGSNGQIQFDDSGVFNGNSGLVYNKATNSLTAAATTSGTQQIGVGANSLQLGNTYSVLQAQNAGSSIQLGSDSDTNLTSYHGNINIAFPNGQLTLGANASLLPSGQLTVTGCSGCGGVTVSAEAFGAAPSSTATVNTAAIQSAFNFSSGGTITLTTCGTYNLNGTLIIYSHLHFSVAPCVTLHQANGTNQSMLINDAFNSRAFTNPATLSWTSGATFNVAKNNHTLVVGNYVWLQGANQSQYNGIFPVTAVIDANNFTVTAQRLPSTAPTGTVTYIPADTDISVEGGTWDYNFAGNPGGAATNADAIILGVVDHAQMRNMNCLNALKYCFEFGAVSNAISENLWGHSNSDILKVYGPAYHGSFRNTSGLAGDDLVSFHNHETNTQFWTYGDGIDLVFDGINGTGPDAAFALYPDSVQYTGGIVTKNVMGQTAVGINIATGSSGGAVDNWRLENIGPFSPTSTMIALGTGVAGQTVTIQNMSIDGLNIDPNYPVGSYAIYQNSLVTLNKFSAANVQVNSTTWGGGGSSYFYFMNGGTLGDFHLRDSYLKGGGTLRLLSVCATCVFNGGTIDDVIMPGSGTDKAIALLAGATGTPQIQIINSQLGGAEVLDLRANANVNLTNNKFSGASAGVINVTGNVTLNISGRGNSTTGKWLDIVSGTPTLIENLLTGQGATQASCPVYTLSNNGTNWTVNINRGVNPVAGIAIPAATTSAPVLFALPGRGKINSIFTTTTTTWSGTGFTSIGLTIGDSTGGATKYTSTSYLLTAAASNTNFQDAMPGFTAAGNNVPLLNASTTYGGSNVLAELTANQNLNANPITGVADITVCWQMLP